MAIGAGLGAAMAAATGADPTKCGLVGAAISTWLTSNCLVLPGTMVAAGAAVSGAGTLSITGSGDSLGDAMSSSLPINPSDAVGIAKWRVIGNALRSHLLSFATVNPVGYVANPAGGPVTGAGTIAISSLVMVPLLSMQLGLFDAANLLAFDPPAGLSFTILANIASTGTALSLGFTSPTGGGPLVGASTVA